MEDGDSKSGQIICFKTRQINLLTRILFIIILAAILYANTLNNGFVYDDDYTVVNNVFISDFHNLTELLQKNYFPSSGEITYRPVVTLTYFIDYALYGLKPWGYHLTNVLLHAANGVLLYIFLTLLFSGEGAPLVTALLFLTHPVLTEAVNAISFREDLLDLYLTTPHLNPLPLRGAEKKGKSPLPWRERVRLRGITFILYPALFTPSHCCPRRWQSLCR